MSLSTAASRPFDGKVALVTGGSSSMVSIIEYSEEAWDRVLDVNLKGVWLCIKYEIPLMLKGGGGAIVNTSSVDGLLGARNRSAYVASKHGIIGVTKAAALEFARHNVRVNAICPAAIRTPMRFQITGGDAGGEARVDEFHPIGRQEEPKEVAATAVWLCSDAAAFITGHALAVDGGVLSA